MKTNFITLYHLSYNYIFIFNNYIFVLNNHITKTNTYSHQYRSLFSDSYELDRKYYKELPLKKYHKSDNYKIKKEK